MPDRLDRLRNYRGGPMNIVLSGSVAFDYLMQFPGLFRDQFLPDKLQHISLSFLVDEMFRHRGGPPPTSPTPWPSWRPAARHGHRGRGFRRLPSILGIGRGGHRADGGGSGKFTASFFATTDEDNAQIASFYAGAMAEGFTPIVTLRNPPARPCGYISQRSNGDG